jgi:phosphate/sulfate permease
MENRKTGTELNLWKWLFLGMCFETLFGKSLWLLFRWAFHLPFSS